MIVALLGCSEPKEWTPTLPEDTARDTATVDSGDTGDSGEAPVDPCAETPDPERGMGLRDLFVRLGAQRCLHEEDILAVEAYMADFEGVGVTCDMILRASSPTGLGDWSDTEVVREHASVPEITITDDGTHHLYYNDLTPGRLQDALRNDPERFWMQGLVGLGGLGASYESGAGWVEDETIDLQLSELMQVVDPDVGRRADGGWHLSFFGIAPEDMEEDWVWDPFETPMPHRFFRHPSDDGVSWEPGVSILDSTHGSRGAADPTLLDLADGGEVLYLGQPDNTIPGWTSPDGVSWDADADADVVTQLGGSVPDAMPDPFDGGYRLYFRNNGSQSFHVATSTDGRTWSNSSEVYDDPEAGGMSVAPAPDGTWWLYYTVRSADCGSDE